MLFVVFIYLLKYVVIDSHDFCPTLMIVEMLSFQIMACGAILIWFLLCTVELAALPSCNSFPCALNTEVCVYKGDKTYMFSSCCSQCQWVNFCNESLGKSFSWSLSSYSYGQYNCINGSINNVLRRVLTIPPNSK